MGCLFYKPNKKVVSTEIIAHENAYSENFVCHTPNDNKFKGNTNFEMQGFQTIKKVLMMLTKY